MQRNRSSRAKPYIKIANFYGGPFTALLAYNLGIAIGSFNSFNSFLATNHLRNGR